MKKGSLFPVSDVPHGIPLQRRAYLRVRTTGEFREPKAGEWYISGAIVEGYRAVGCGNRKFWICELVRVETRTITTVVEVIK